MLSFIDAFFDNMSLWFPFIAYDETIKRFLTQDLPVFQANCIAALAVRYVRTTEILEFGILRATDDYASAAKVLYVIFSTLKLLILALTVISKHGDSKRAGYRHSSRPDTTLVGGVQSAATGGVHALCPSESF
jgi:hypothetical protein